MIGGFTESELTQLSFFMAWAVTIPRSLANPASVASVFEHGTDSVRQAIATFIKKVELHAAGSVPTRNTLRTVAKELLLDNNKALYATGLILDRALLARGKNE